jgi:hypothetical protein
MFYHSALVMAALLLLALCGSKLLPFSTSNAKQNGQSGGKSCPHCGPRSNQMIYLPLIDLPEAGGSEIVFNSRSPQEMDVTPTFYKLDGTAIIGDVVRIKSAEIRYADLKKLIPGKYRNDSDWGGMSLAYTGVTREMWAQFRLLRINGGSNVDEFFNVPSEVRSDLQEAVWWVPPQSTAVIALGNITDTATSATIRFGDGQERAVSLAPHATEIIRHAPLFSTNSESVTIKITGAAGSVIPTGLITSANGSFNSVIRFYETKMANQSHLFGNGLRLAGTTPRLALMNTSSAPINVTPKFIPLEGAKAESPVTLPVLNLGSQQTVVVDLGPLMNAAQHRSDLDTVSVELSNKGAPGSLIGALYSSDKTTGVNYDVPLRDSGPVRTMTGSYPWKIDDDFTTIVYITNISDGPAGFMGEINYDGGKYMIDPRSLAAGETAVFDMRKAIADQKPDSAKRRLPVKVSGGQFKWAVRGVTGGKVILIGRAEMVSRSQRISTSYSCNDPCPPFYGGSITPDSPTVEVESVDTMTSWETAYYNGGYTVGPYQVGAQSWTSDNPSVVTVPGGICTALSPGFAGVRAFIRTEESYVWDGLNCVDLGVIYDVAGDTGVTVKPSITRLEPDRGLIGKTYSVTVVGAGFEAPASVNVAGSGVTATVKSIGSRSIVADFAIAANAGPGNHAVTVTVNGQTSSSKNFFVQIPKTLRRDQITDLTTIDPGPGIIKDIFNQTVMQNACGAYVNLKYTLLDQDNPAQPIKFEDGVQIIEQLSNFQGTSGLQSKLIPFNNFTNNVGQIGDVVGLAGTSPDCPPPFAITFTQGFKAQVGSTMYTLTTINSISESKAANGTWAITVTITTP